MRNWETEFGLSIPFRVPSSEFRIPHFPVPRVGIEPTLPLKAAGEQAARRPTARPKPGLSGVARVGVEPTVSRFELGRSAGWRTVP